MQTTVRRPLKIDIYYLYNIRSEQKITAALDKQIFKVLLNITESELTNSCSKKKLIRNKFVITKESWL